MCHLSKIRNNLLVAGWFPTVFTHVYKLCLTRSRLAALVATIATIIVAMPSPAQAQPGSRVYELISPAQKSGGIGGVFPLGTLTRSEQYGQPMQSAVDGSAIIYEGEDFYQPRLGGIDQYLSMREPAGWSTKNLTPEAIQQNVRYAGLAPDLSTGVLSDELSREAPGGFSNLYLGQNGNLTPLITSPPPNRTLKTFGSSFRHGLGGQPDISTLPLFAGGNAGTSSVTSFSHLIFEANAVLAPNAVEGGEYENNLYEWTGAGLTAVNILPGATESTPNASFGINYEDQYGTTRFPNLSHVISDDGARIFWTGENSNDSNLYMRENGVNTVQVDAAVGGGGQFQTASADGSKVFFTKEEHLYEYNTSDGSTTEVGSSGVLGMLGASDDGAYVYFVSTSAFTPGAVEAQPNLYLSREEHLTFVATLSLADNETPSGTGGGGVEELGDWQRTFAGRTAEVSPNGRYVAFMAKENLTGYETLDPNSEAHDYEVYVYEAEGALACASCNTDGTPPTASTILPSAVNGVYQQRYLNDEGQLFFSTQDPVLPEDTDGTSDVYEYRGGNIGLISPGSAEDEAVFADTSEKGNDVFFTTRQQLVPADKDQIIDLYDARVEGRPEEAALSQCSGEGCHEPVTSSLFQAPISAAFAGSGNLAPPTPQPAVVHKPLTRAQKLAKALKVCRARHNKHRRAVCTMRARRLYR